MKKLAELNPLDPAVIENPYPFFEALRREAPLYALPNGAYYVISRFDDVQRATLDTETYSSRLIDVLMAGLGGGKSADFSGAEAGPQDVLAIADPPRHTPQRRISNRAFTLRRVTAMEPGIRALAEQLLDNFIDAGEADWVGDLAVPLPMTIIIDLLGFPRSDMPRLKVLSDASVALLSGVTPAEEMPEILAKVAELFDYLAERFDEASPNPGDNVLGELLRAAHEDAEHFSREEVISILVQMLTAGNETTTSLIGSALYLLLQDDELQQRLREQPERIEAFVEEALRLESPFHGHFRVVRKNTEVAGQSLSAGSRVMLLWGGANRDESVFEHADQVDIDRPNVKRHLAFGYGIHHCIGAALARLEARVALEVLLARTLKVSLKPGAELSHVPSLFIRSLKSLPIEFTKNENANSLSKAVKGA